MFLDNNLSSDLNANNFLVMAPRIPTFIPAMKSVVVGLDIINRIVAVFGE